MKISIGTARKLILQCQCLDGKQTFAKGKEGIAQTIEHIGYVQIDTIAVIQRAHHHVIWTRRPDYASDMLDQFQAVDRRLLDYWTHAASYVPFRDYRYYLPRMKAVGRSEGTRQFRRENAKLFKEVLHRIRHEGALGSADFKTTKKAGSWWGWKPAKRVLDSLFHSGELMTTARRNFQRLYDLSERVIPAGIDTSEPTPDDFHRFVVRQALATRGILPRDQIRWSYRQFPAAGQFLRELVDAGEAAAVEVEGMDDTFYALSENLDKLPRGRRKKLHILSPFDNLVIDRRRLLQLFGFDYSIECYLPAAKRRYGYFCLPILWGTDFAGRLDPKADRKSRTFIVRKLTLEPDFDICDSFLPALAEKLQSFAAFNGCEQIAVEATEPRKIKAPLKRALG
jgi:uncharacterized protein